MGEKNVGLMSNIGLQSMLKKHQLINATVSDIFLENIAFPMIQRISARTLGMDLVTVQPLAAPTGMIFYMDYGDNNRSKYSRPGRIGIHVNGINVLSDRKLILTSRNVMGGERRLRATWTPEMAQDVQAFHGIDAEDELTRLLSENIAQEIDQLILNNVRGMADAPAAISWNVVANRNLGRISPIRSSLFS
jgi:hypothetical protein